MYARRPNLARVTRLPMSPSIKSRLLATQSDERLMALVHEGHEAAFEALVHRYRKPLLRYCRSLCLCEARAEDALQQALLNAWIAMRRSAEVRELRPWLYRVAHNASVNAMRGDRVRSVEPLGENHEQIVARRGQGAPSLDEVLALRDALASMAALPQMQREAILRTAVAGHSHEEVASALGVTDGAVRGLLYRARASLREGVSALTPGPLLAWMANAGATGSSSGERIAELAAGGGTAGLGVAIKGGIVAITAGVAITGAVVAPGHGPRAGRHTGFDVAHRHTPQSTGEGVVASADGQGTVGIAPTSLQTAGARSGGRLHGSRFHAGSGRFHSGDGRSHPTEDGRARSGGDLSPSAAQDGGERGRTPHDTAPHSDAGGSSHAGSGDSSLDPMSVGSDGGRAGEGNENEREATSPGQEQPDREGTQSTEGGTSSATLTSGSWGRSDAQQWADGSQAGSQSSGPGQEGELPEAGKDG